MLIDRTTCVCEEVGIDANDNDRDGAGAINAYPLLATAKINRSERAEEWFIIAIFSFVLIMNLRYNTDVRVLGCDYDEECRDTGYIYLLGYGSFLLCVLSSIVNIKMCHYFDDD